MNSGALKFPGAFFLVLLSIPVPAVFSQPPTKDHAPHLEDLYNMRQVAIGLRAYALEKEGHFPPSLSSLFEPESGVLPSDQAPELLFYHGQSPEKDLPIREIGLRSDWFYIPGHTSDSSSDAILLFAPAQIYDEFAQGEMMVATVGGDTNILTASEFASSVLQTRQSIYQNYLKKAFPEADPDIIERIEGPVLAYLLAHFTVHYVKFNRYFSTGHYVLSSEDDFRPMISPTLFGSKRKTLIPYFLFYRAERDDHLAVTIQTEPTSHLHGYETIDYLRFDELSVQVSEDETITFIEVGHPVTVDFNTERWASRLFRLGKIPNTPDELTIHASGVATRYDQTEFPFELEGTWRLHRSREWRMGWNEMP